MFTTKRVITWFITIVVLLVAAIMGIPHVLPWVLSKHRPDLQFVVATDEKTLFLTIDDAPSTNTPEILRVLKKHDVTATFFVIADRVRTPAQLAEIIAGGHALGNHLKTTRACSKLSLAEFQADFDACAKLLGDGSGAQLVRPASDFGTTEQIAYARKKGFRPTMGTVFPLDHWISNRTWLVRITRWLAVRGGIVILHDGDVRGRTTAEVLDELIPKLKADGYNFAAL